jgi:ABC-2 type transport system ATP-binding protein
MQVELIHVSKRFGNGTVLDRVSLSVAPGERIAFVGPNGSGKSTLVRAIVGMVKVEGTIRLDGLEPSLDWLRLAPRVAYVPQNAPQLNASVGEMVQAVEGLRGLPAGAVAQAARRFDLPSAELWKRPVRNLSGGTRQKLMLALAFASPVSLLVLDEPTASLDPETRERFFKFYDEAACGCTVLLCSHRPEEVRYLADRVITLEEGRIARESSVEGFLEEEFPGLDLEAARESYRDSY